MTAFMKKQLRKGINKYAMDLRLGFLCKSCMYQIVHVKGVGLNDPTGIRTRDYTVKGC